MQGLAVLASALADNDVVLCALADYDMQSSTIQPILSTVVFNLKSK